MSIKDLIWVNTAQGVKFRLENQARIDKAENNFKIVESLLFSICDCREIALDSNLQMRTFVAMQGGQKRVKAFDPKILPSIRIPEDREEAEKMAKMTPEELAQKQIDDFLAGKNVVL